jgi:5'-3' exonuclease
MDEDTYRRTVTEAVVNYFESIVFTMRYYLRGCPDYSWHYRYRVSPLPSDMLTVMDRFSFSVNAISFLGVPPMEPMAQLLMILPPQMRHLLPARAREVMDVFPEVYPKTFEVDALAGFKYIYSEAILPELDCDRIRAALAERAHEMDESEKKRNTISTALLASKAAGAVPKKTAVAANRHSKKPRFLR